MKNCKTEDLSDFQRGQIFGARLDGASVTKTATVNPGQQLPTL